MTSSKTLTALFPTTLAAAADRKNLLTRLSLTRSVLVVFALASLALGGCGSQIQTHCESYTECWGGNDKDIDACVAETEGEQEVASAYDCSEPFDKLADCIESTGKCEDKQYKYECNTESTALYACEHAASEKSKKSGEQSEGNGD